MLVGAATLQHMDLQILETLTFISGEGARIRCEGILPAIPRSNFAEEVVMSLGTVETHMSLCLYSTSFTFHPTALLLSIHSELPFSC